jgi:hypothetical protein
LRNVKQANAYGNEDVLHICVFLNLIIVFSQFKPDESQEDGEEGE